jgi:ABC-2 type transport system permease protein
MRALGNIIVKEARELLTPQMLVPFVVMMVMMVGISRAIRSERARTAGPQAVLVADLDGSAVSARLVERLRAEKSISVVPATGTREELLADAAAEGAGWVLVLPESLGARVERGAQSELEAYNVVRGFSMMQAMRTLEVKTLLSALNSELVRERLSRAFPGEAAATLEQPLARREFVWFRGRLAWGSAELLQGVVMSQTFLIPVVLLMIIIYSSQMIAASIGQEKENKTLETLLTVPISRVSIVIGKMVGAVLVALVVAGLFMATMVYYTGAMAGELPGAAGAGAAVLAELDLGLTLTSYLLVAAALFLAVVCALSLATLLAIFADDAKSAQVTVTPLMALVLLPYMMTMFLDVGAMSLPVRLLVYAIPFSYPFLTPRAVFMGDYGVVLGGFGYMAAFAAGCIWLAAWMFSSDRVLTAKLRLRRR